MGRYNSQEGSTLKTAVTIGNFDGVHRGHVYLLKNFLNLSRALDLEPLVLSFYGHPRVFKEAPPLQYLLTTPEERSFLIKQLGIERVEFVKLDRETMNMTPEEFIRSVLIEKYNMKMLFMGFNHHFGRNREGTPQHVATLVGKCGFSLVVMPPYLIDGVVVSSTLIRSLIKEGKVRDVIKYLGREYHVCGRVIEGKKVARNLLGLKTANVDLSPLKLIPPSGIYAVWVDIDDKTLPGALYIGDSPTIKNEFSFEVHILDFNEDIYGKKVCVRFVERIRGNQKFDSVTLLKKAILQDIEKAKGILK